MIIKIYQFFFFFKTETEKRKEKKKKKEEEEEKKEKKKKKKERKSKKMTGKKEEEKVGSHLYVRCTCSQMNPKEKLGRSRLRVAPPLQKRQESSWLVDRRFDRRRVKKYGVQILP